MDGEDTSDRCFSGEAENDFTKYLPAVVLCSIAPTMYHRPKRMLAILVIYFWGGKCLKEKC